MKDFLWMLVVATGVVIGSTHPILINLGKDTNGNILFSSASVALSIELLKLLISGCFVFKDVVTNTNIALPHFSVYILFAVPAILYTVVNNLVTHAQIYMDPSSFQILNNLKIVSTAIFYKLIINTHVSNRRWAAVVLLFLGGVINSIGGLQKDRGNIVSESKETFVTMKGIYLMCIYCSVSGLAGVYTEAVLKKHKQTSIHVQNSVLYGFGIFMNGLIFSFNSVSSLQTRGFFDGFTIYTWLIVVSQAINGIIISIIMKHLSNITRLVMIGCSMILTTLLSYVTFGISMDLYFLIAFILVMMALYLYYDNSLASIPIYHRKTLHT